MTEHSNVEIDKSNPTIIKVDFGLTWRQITIAFAFIASLIGGGAGAGWLVLPASKTDLSKVEQSLTEQIRALQVITSEVRQLQAVNNETVAAIDELRGAVTDLSGGIARQQANGRQRASVGSRKPTAKAARPPGPQPRQDAWREGSKPQGQRPSKTASF